MAGNIKGITIEIDGNVQPLNKALKDVSSTSTQLNKELNTINKLLKLDPSNVVLMAQKQQVLTDQIDKTKQKLDTLKEAQRQASEQLAQGKIGVEQYREVERQVQATEQQLNRYENELQQVESQSKETATATGKIGDETQKATTHTDNFSRKGVASFAAVTAAVTAVVAGISRVTSKIIDGAKEVAQYADDINTMSAMYRVSTETLQEFAFASDVVDVSIETFGKSLGKLTKNIGNAQKGTKDQVEAFQALGVSYEDSAGKLRRSEDVFYDIIDALGTVEDETQADIYANALFGRSFQDLLPLVSAGTDTLRELGAEAHKMGAVLPQETLDRLNSFQDVLDKIKVQAKLAAVPFMEGLIPALNDTYTAIAEKLASPAVQSKLRELGEKVGEFAQKAVKMLMDMAEFVMENGDTIIKVIAGIAAGFAAFKIAQFVSGFVSGMQAVSASVKGAEVATKGLNATMAANPIGFVIAAVVALGTVLAGFIAEAAKADSHIQALSDSAKDLNEAVGESENNFAGTMGAITAQADAARGLVSEIENLDAKMATLDTDSAEYAITAEALRQKTAELNAIYPETGALIDENTGRLTTSTEALWQEVEALQAKAEAQAYEERYAEVIKNEADARIKKAEAEAAYRAELEKLSPVEQERWKNVIDGNALTGTAIDMLSLMNGNLRESANAYVYAADAEADAKKQKEAFIPIYKKQKDAQQDLNKTTAEAPKVLKALTDAEAEALIATKERGEEILAEQQQQLSEWQSMKQAEAAAQEEANRKVEELYKERLSVSQNFWDKTKEDEALSVKEMEDNLIANQEAMTEWTNNLALLASSGLDKGFIEELRKSGVKSKGTVKNMVDEMDKEGFAGWGKFNTTYREGAQTAVDAVETEMMSDSTTKIPSESLDKMAKEASQNKEIQNMGIQQIKDLRSAMESQIVASDFPALGSSIMSKLQSGISSMSGSIMSTVNRIVNNIKSAFKFEVQVSGTGKGAKFSVPGAAAGGIVFQDRIIRVAERGPEAIIPLDKMGGIVAAALEQAGGGRAGNFTMNVYTKEMTQAQTDYLVTQVRREIGRRVVR